MVVTRLWYNAFFFNHQIEKLLGLGTQILN